MRQHTKKYKITPGVMSYFIYWVTLQTELLSSFQETTAGWSLAWGSAGLCSKHHLTCGTASLGLLGCTGGHPLPGLSTALVWIPSCLRACAAFFFRVTGTGMFSDLLGNTERDFLPWLLLCLASAPVLPSKSFMQISLVFSCNSSML